MIGYLSASMSAYRAMREANKAANEARIVCEAELAKHYAEYVRHLDAVASEGRQAFFDHGAHIVVMGRTVA